MKYEIRLAKTEIKDVQLFAENHEEAYKRALAENPGFHGDIITEFLAEDELISLNTEERNSRDSKPWSAGLGSEKGGNVPMVRVGRIPLAVLFNKIVPYMKLGDKDHLKWWLNRDENQWTRTKSGKL